MSAFLGYEVEPCWNCASPRMDSFRYCPNCGLWLDNRTPIRYSRGTNIHSGKPFLIAMDDGQTQHRASYLPNPDFHLAALSSGDATRPTGDKG